MCLHTANTYSDADWEGFIAKPKEQSMPVLFLADTPRRRAESPASDRSSTSSDDTFAAVPKRPPNAPMHRSRFLPWIAYEPATDEHGLAYQEAALRTESPHAKDARYVLTVFSF